MKVVSKRLQVLIKEKKLTNNEFAEYIGVSHGCLSNWINERNYISLPCIVRVCELCTVSSDWLLGLTDERSK